MDVAAHLAVAAFDPPSDRVQAENAYTLHSELQQSMNDLVGIIRKAHEIEQALDKLSELKARLRNVMVEGHRQYNPGWHLTIDLRNMLMVSEAVAKAALTRTESRGGHTRDDYPELDPRWRNTLLVCRAEDNDLVVPGITVLSQEQVPMREDLLELFERSELENYYTEGELAPYPRANS